MLGGQLRDLSDRLQHKILNLQRNLERHVYLPGLVVLGLDLSFLTLAAIFLLHTLSRSSMPNIALFSLNRHQISSKTSCWSIEGYRFAVGTRTRREGLTSRPPGPLQPKSAQVDVHV